MSDQTEASLNSEPTEQVLRWYAGLLLEISPIDEATWDYDKDLRQLTEDEAYTLSPTDGMIQEMKLRLAALPLETVQADADAGDPWMRIELSLRYVRAPRITAGSHGLYKLRVWLHCAV